MTRKKQTKTKSHKRFISGIKKAFILFILGYILLECVLWFSEDNGTLIEPYAWGNRNEIPYKINHCHDVFSDPKNKDKVKIVIVGDSGPETAFNPELLDSLFFHKTISYNLAFYGTAIRVQSLLINKIIIPKIKPDILIWDLGIPNDFEDSKKINDQENATLSHPGPRYYNDNTEGLGFEDLCRFYLYKYSRFYRYRKTLRPSLFNLNEDYQVLIKGYGKLYEKGWIKHIENEVTDENQNVTEITYLTDGYSDPSNLVYNFILHEESKDLYFDTIKTIEKRTDYFFIINRAGYKQKIICPLIYSYFNKLSPKNFFDLNGYEDLNVAEYWWNESHLNMIGAEVYTRLIYEKISQNFRI